MPTFELRAASAEDLATLVQFNAAMALETESLVLDQARLQAGVTALLENPERGLYRVALAEGEIVGALMLTREWSDWRCGDWWWIQSVYVRPEWRRRGVFAALYRAVETEAAVDPSVCGLRLYVEHDNAAAQQTYRAQGMLESHYRMFERGLRG